MNSRQEKLVKKILKGINSLQTYMTFFFPRTTKEAVRQDFHVLLHNDSANDKNASQKYFNSGPHNLCTIFKVT